MPLLGLAEPGAGCVVPSGPTAFGLGVVLGSHALNIAATASTPNMVSVFMLFSPEHQMNMKAW
jgi:hypothetical protein